MPPSISRKFLLKRSWKLEYLKIISSPWVSFFFYQKKRGNLKKVLSTRLFFLYLRILTFLVHHMVFQELSSHFLCCMCEFSHVLIISLVRNTNAWFQTYKLSIVFVNYFILKSSPSLPPLFFHRALKHTGNSVFHSTGKSFCLGRNSKVGISIILKQCSLCVSSVNGEHSQCNHLWCNQSNAIFIGKE